MPNRISGTKEWSVASANCLSGCEHNCRYCYARASALRFGRIATPEQWSESRLRPAEVKKRRRKESGPVMFPSTHDITPQFLRPCLEVIWNILRPGNDLLIVSKPHIECIEAICRETRMFREAVLFRFSVGSANDSILSYWEPGAPSFDERFACLRYAHKQGFRTSVSCEPLLDAEHAVELFTTLEPFVTDSIWFGKLNKIRQRCVLGTSEQEIGRIEAGQTDERIWVIHAALKNEPKVRWKESYKEVLELELATEAGLDT